MDKKGKALMVDYEEQEVDLLQISTPEFSYYGDLNRENHVKDASNFVWETNTFARIPSFPEPIVIPPPPPPALNSSTAQFLFKKELKSSDVGRACRIIIPKAHAMNFLPPLTDGNGIFLYLDDMNAPNVWVFRFRYWQNNNSRMYVLEKTGDFVKAHGLRVGDVVLFYKDEQTERYGIQAMENPNEQATPMGGENEPMSYYGDLILNNEVGTYTYLKSNMQNYMMNFLGGPDLTFLNVEQSMSFDPTSVYPYYSF